MPRPRNKKNKVLPKVLRPGVENFKYWGRKVKEIFPHEPTSPLPSPRLTVRSPLPLPEAQWDPFIEYQPIPSADETSAEIPDELSPSGLDTDNSQLGSSSISYHPSRPRSIRTTRNTIRNNTNDSHIRPTQPSRRQRSRRSRTEIGHTVHDMEVLHPSGSSGPSSSSASSFVPLQGGLSIEPKHHDRSTSFLPESLELEPRQSGHPTINQKPDSFYRSSQLLATSSESFPISDPAGTTSQTDKILTTSFSPGMDPLSLADSVRVNSAAAEYSLSMSSEPRHLPLSSAHKQVHVNDASTSTYLSISPSRNSPSSSQFPTPSSIPSNPHTHSVFATDTYAAHASSSSLYPMAQYFHQNSSQSSNEAIMNDSAVDRASSSYRSSSGNCLLLSQPSTSVIPQISDVLMDTPEETHAAYTTSSRLMFQMEAPGLQTTSSSFPLAQSTLQHVSTFEDDANIRDNFSPSGMNYRASARSHSYPEQSSGLVQRADHGHSQRTKHAYLPDPTYAGHNYHPTNATSSRRSISYLKHNQRQGGSSSANLPTQADWY